MLGLCSKLRNFCHKQVGLTFLKDEYSHLGAISWEEREISHEKLVWMKSLWSLEDYIPERTWLVMGTCLG